MKTLLPRTIFNLCGIIPIGENIYTSREEHSQKFGGINTVILGYEYLVYQVPDNDNPDRTNDKTISKKELEILWLFLIQNEKIRTQDIINLCPALYNRGGCCVGALYGIINYLFPNVFVKGHGFIVFKEVQKLTVSKYTEIERLTHIVIKDMLTNFNIIIVDENGKPLSRKFWNQRLKGIETLSIN